MHDEIEPYPFTSWSPQIDLIRRDLDFAMRLEVNLALGGARGTSGA